MPGTWGSKIGRLLDHEVNLLYSRCFQNLSMVAILINAGWITYLTVTWRGVCASSNQGLEPSTSP